MGSADGTKVMPNRETVSVIVPCYNAADWISEALRSVYQQQWPALEVLVVDDGSIDDSVALVEREFPQAKVLRQPNGGAAAARNAGIRAASGQWVAFIDADDYWLPGKLEAQMTLLAACPEADVACTSWDFWTSADPAPSTELLEALRQDSSNSTRWEGPTGWIYPDLLLGCQVWTSTVVMRTALLRELGGFDTSLRIGEDYDLWLRASRLSQILRVKLPLALYRQHPHSLTKQPPARNYEADVVRKAIDKWGYRSPDGRSANKSGVENSLSRTWHTFGAANLAAGRVDAGMLGARTALVADWRNFGAWKLLLKALVARITGCK